MGSPCNKCGELSCNCEELEMIETLTKAIVLLFAEVIDNEAPGFKVVVDKNGEFKFGMRLADGDTLVYELEEDDV